MNRSERIVSLEQQLENLKSRNRKAEQVLRNRKQRLENAEAVRERQLDTRRKILIGKAVLLAIEDDAQLRNWYFSDFRKHLSRDRDRKLFPDLSFDSNVAHPPRRCVRSPFRRVLDRLSSLARLVPPERRSS